MEVRMFRRNKRQIKNVTFVQPLRGESYFYTPIAHSTILQNPEGKEGVQVFKDSDLALAGKLKLIFQREKMVWFEIKEEKSKTSKDERIFALYYYPHRLVASRSLPFEEKTTLRDIKKLINFIVTKNQTRFAKIQRIQSPSAYGSIAEAIREDSDAIETITVKPSEETEAETIITNRGKQ